MNDFSDYLDWVLTNAKGDESKGIKLEIQAIKEFKANLKVIQKHHKVYNALKMLEKNGINLDYYSI